MRWRLVGRLAAILVLQGFWAGMAHAQIGPVQTSICDAYLTANDLGVDFGVPAPPTAVLVYQNTVPGEEGLSIYRVPTRACVPPCPCPLAGAAGGGGAPSGGGGAPMGGAASGGRGAPGSGGGGAPMGGAASGGGGVPIGGSTIDLATGNTSIVQNDVRIPGLSAGLSLFRTWNSLGPQSGSAFPFGLFGLDWSSTYEERVLVDNDGFLKYFRSDGSYWTFVWGTGTSYSVAAPASATANLSLDSGYTQWTLTFQNGEKRTFSYSSPSLTSIVDRNGNTTLLAYDSLNRLVTVTDPGGRHLYFAYPNNSSYFVTSVTSDVGISLSYAYDSQGRLTQVTQPDLTTLSFAYDANSHIVTITDSSGKVLESHTYDSQGRGLTSSRANGVEAITVSYAGQ